MVDVSWYAISMEATRTPSVFFYAMTAGRPSTQPRICTDENSLRSRGYCSPQQLRSWIFPSPLYFRGPCVRRGPAWGSRNLPVATIGRCLRLRYYAQDRQSYSKSCHLFRQSGSSDCVGFSLLCLLKADADVKQYDTNGAACVCEYDVILAPKRRLNRLFFQYCITLGTFYWAIFHFPGSSS